MDTTTILAMGGVGLGLALLVIGLLLRTYQREERLVDFLDLPYGEQDVDLLAATQQSAVVENLSGFAGRVMEQLDTKGAVLRRLEAARIPVRPGELAVLVICGGVVLGALITGLTGRWLLGLGGLVAAPVIAKTVLDTLISRRRKKFEAQFPDALSLIASSMTSGHTFLRSIQMMTEEAPAPISEEFARVISETQLGDPMVDAMERMAVRLDVRDVDWVVQAIRIQQQVGGKMADLLHTLADFIRQREELRREVSVLTAEGRMSAIVLAALPPVLMLFISLSQPGYLDPLFEGKGLFVLAGCAVSVITGFAVIRKMVKIEV